MAVDTTQEKRQETMRRGTEPHRNAITQDTTQEKRHGTLRRGRERKHQEGNMTRRRKNGKKLCVAAKKQQGEDFRLLLAAYIPVRVKAPMRGLMRRGWLRQTP